MSPSIEITHPPDEYWHGHAEMRLTDLEPQLYFTYGQLMEPTNDVSKAVSLFFLCPVCFAKNGGNVGTHGILCHTPKVPPHIDPKQGRWNLVGNSLEDLSLVAGSSSVLLTSGCKAHFFVENGEIVGC